MKPFLALDRTPGIGDAKPVVIVDLGYSSNKRSCGLASTGEEEALEMQFGNAIVEARERLARSEWEAVLVLEAALSTFHQANGNPAIRGEFEAGRGWYYGAGVLSLAAARRFLHVLAEQLPDGLVVSLAEAFLSNKGKPSRHADDAKVIRDNFWETRPALLGVGVEPASSLIDGVPAVRVFEGLR